MSVKTLETELKTLHTQCPYCSVQCKLALTPEPQQAGSERASDSIFMKSEGLPNEASQGRACVKGLNAYQHAVNGQRLLEPLIRRGGTLEPCSWEEALEAITDGWKKLMLTDGPDSIGFYGGGSLTNETAYWLGKFARIAVGTRLIDYNGRFCMSAAASAGVRSFGLDRGLTFRLSDIPKAKCIILAGTNVAECQPTLMPYFNEAKARGACIIVLDPRRTKTAELADIHLQLKPGEDARLAALMLRLILDEGLENRGFIEARTEGFEEAVRQLEGIDTAFAAEKCGVKLEDVRLAAAAYAGAETAILCTARGVEQQTDGHEAVRQFINLVLATGHIGREGCGYGAITGQGNGQGGREHGQKADQLPGYRSIENPAHREYIAGIWGVDPSDIPGKGVSAFEMMELVHDGTIQSLFVMGSNPVVSNPHAGFVEEGLRGLNQLVVADMFMSETALLADVVLPVTSYLENEGTLTNLEGRVLLREAALPAPGECRHDWVILNELAAKLGRGEHFNCGSSEAIFTELRRASRGGDADYYGITYERIRGEGGVYWPCLSEEEEGCGLMFTDGFARPNGRAQFGVRSEAGTGPRDEPGSGYPLLLTNGRVLPHYLTGVQTRRSPSLAARELESFVEIHPATAAALGIADGEWVAVSSRQGEFSVRSRLNDRIREDTVFAPMHWGGKQNVNLATRPELDPVCRMPGFKTTAVRITPLRRRGGR
ncbi:molybdopterin oxidoreductase family protein [Paenibacillus pasadenensis]|uniref:molybdopterin oxidoreductase family protein n=1 Tax=Paenibacillus pasadenensis TaxID=217090 RepID=UPI00203EFF86|nr:molybdopterin oxidoreductase family protein [Paenibacillus pasadenensis]